MTNITAIVISLCLILNDFTIILNERILDDKFLPSSLVYLTSICLLLREWRLVPKMMLRKCYPICFLLEIPISLIILESSMVFVWRLIRDYIYTNADSILVNLADDKGMESLICYICCGKSNCSRIVADLALKGLSFTMLLGVCAFIGSRQFSLSRVSARTSISSRRTSREMQRNRIERSASKRWRGSVRRVVSATIYNLSCFTHGCSTGWVSGVLGTEALTGGAWLAALPCLVALPAAPFFAVLADSKGRKAAMFCVCVSFIISWSLAAWCGARGVWAARVAAGAGGAGALALAPLYCAEIAPRTKGLAAMPALACSCGILFAYGAGGMLSPHALSLCMTVPPAILLFSLLWLPETPSFLINVGRIQDAAKVMCWFDGSDFREDLTDVIEQQEVRIRTSECPGRRDLRRHDSDTFQPMLKRVSGLDSNSDKKTEPSACRELFRHRRSRRALLSCCVLLCAAAGSGAGAVNSFAAAVLRHSTHAVPHLNLTAYNFSIYNGTVPRTLFGTSEAGSMLCGTALVLGAAVATVTVDKFGRKTLLLWSCSGIACCLAILGVYCDPKVRMFSWYSHRLWPYKRISFREKPSYPENLLNSPYNVTDVLKNFTNVSLRYHDDVEIMRPWSKVENGSEETENVSWMKYGQKEKEDISIWLPVLLLSLMLFLYNIGLGSVPYVLISELFTIHVRSLASSFCISWMWLSNFLLLRYYGTIAISLGLHGAYYISACITVLGAVYINFVIPETKGRSQEQIDEALDRPLLGRHKAENVR